MCGVAATNAIEPLRVFAVDGTVQAQFFTVTSFSGAEWVKSSDILRMRREPEPCLNWLQRY